MSDISYQQNTLKTIHPFKFNFSNWTTREQNNYLSGLGFSCFSVWVFQNSFQKSTQDNRRKVQDVGQSQDTQLPSETSFHLSVSMNGWETSVLSHTCHSPQQLYWTEPSCQPISSAAEKVQSPFPTTELLETDTCATVKYLLLSVSLLVLFTLD